MIARPHDEANEGVPVEHGADGAPDSERAEETQPRIEFIMVCDYAEALNGKLYIMGGAWDRLTVRKVPTEPRPLSLALSLVIPWSATNMPHSIRVELSPEAPPDNGLTIEGTVETGRPPGVKRGTPLRSVAVFNSLVSFGTPGRQTIRTFMNERPGPRTYFDVIVMS